MLFPIFRYRIVSQEYYAQKYEKCNRVKKHSDLFAASALSNKIENRNIFFNCIGFSTSLYAFWEVIPLLKGLFYIPHKKDYRSYQQQVLVHFPNEVHYFGFL